MTTASARRTERVNNGSLVTAALFAAVLAVVVNLVIWAVAQLLLGLNVQIQAGGPAAPVTTLDPISVIVTSIIPAVAATLLLAVLGRFTARPYTIFLIIAGVFLLLSFIPSWSLLVGVTSKLVLTLMHIGAAASIVWALVTRTRTP